MLLKTFFYIRHKTASVLFLASTIAFLVRDATASDRNEMDEEWRKVALKNGIDPDSPKPGTVFITPPKLSDEEEKSQFMPARYRCDGCTVIAHQLKKHFEVAERSKTKGDTLSEADILTATESVCENEFSNYGLKNVHGTNMLSGEGLPAEKNVWHGRSWREMGQTASKHLQGNYGRVRGGVCQSMYLDKTKTLKDAICSAYCGRNSFEPWRDEF